MKEESCGGATDPAVEKMNHLLEEELKYLKDLRSQLIPTSRADQRQVQCSQGAEEMESNELAREREADISLVSVLKVSKRRKQTPLR